MPAPEEHSTVQAAAKIITDTMLQAGMDPVRAIDHPMVRGIVERWLRGQWTQEEVIDACRDLLMMYPQLRRGMV
jgi:hypothetical protein